MGGELDWARVPAIRQPKQRGAGIRRFPAAPVLPRCDDQVNITRIFYPVDFPDTPNRGAWQRGCCMRWLRAIAVWVLLMSSEVVHGVARTLLLAPAVGDFRARQLAVFSGSLLILSITCLTIRWLQVTATRWLVSIGVVWVALTLAFEIGLGRLVGSSWSRIASDYNLLQGGLMPIGLGIMAMSPWIASRFRRLPPALSSAGFSARPAK